MSSLHLYFSLVFRTFILKLLWIFTFMSGTFLCVWIVPDLCRVALCVLFVSHPALHRGLRPHSLEFICSHYWIVNPVFTHCWGDVHPAYFRLDQEASAVSSLQCTCLCVLSVTGGVWLRYHAFPVAAWLAERWQCPELPWPHRLASVVLRGCSFYLNWSPDSCNSRNNPRLVFVCLEIYKPIS